MNKYSSYPHKQQGAALAVGLILLLIITLMGYTSMKGTMLQEKMAAGLHNRSLAYSGANSALRQGESFLYNLVEVTNGVNVKGTPNGSLNDLFTLLADPDDPTSIQNPVLTEFFERNWVSTRGTEHLHDFLSIGGNGALAAQPQYLIHEVLFGESSNDTTSTDDPASGGGDGNKQRSFVVTGKSQSGDGRSIAMVQSLYTVVTGSDATN